MVFMTKFTIFRYLYRQRKYAVWTRRIDHSVSSARPSHGPMHTKGTTRCIGVDSVTPAIGRKQARQWEASLLLIGQDTRKDASVNCAVLGHLNPHSWMCFLLTEI